MTQNVRTFELETRTGLIGKCEKCQKQIEESQQSIEITTKINSEINGILPVGKYHAKCVMIKNYFVAFIDILGFTKDVRNKPLDEVFDTMNTLFDCAAKSHVTASVRVGRSSSVVTVGELQYVVLSDSVFAYKEIPSNSDEEIQKNNKITSFNQFYDSIREIFQEAFKKKIKLRAGISYGKAIIRLDLDYKNNLIIGKPIVESYLCEQSQKWMGVAFHKSMADFLAENSFTFMENYKLPIKRKFRKACLPKITIGWVDMTLETKKDSFFNSWIVSSIKEKKYKKNTLKFYEKYKDTAHPIRSVGVTLLSP